MNRFCCLSVALLSLVSGAFAETLGAGWRVVVPAKAADSAVWWALRQGAEEFCLAVREETGLKLEIVESDAPVDGRAIYVGSSLARRDGLPVAGLVGWDNAYAERKGSLYFYGAAERCGLEDRRSVGWARCLLPSLRALTRFMEDRMGVRFVMPGVTGMEVPSVRPIEVPAGLASVEHPRITFGASGNRGMLASIANQCFGAGTFKTFGGHLYPVACPMEKYAKSHPEYFGIIRGKRYCEWPWAKNGYAPLCFTNPEVEELIVAELLRHYDAGADVCQLAPSDSAHYCECEKCQNYGGLKGNAGENHAEQIWLFHRHIAERIEKLRPGKIVHILSYGPTHRPPRDFKTFPSNVMIEVCETTEETLKLWHDFKVPHGLTVYTYLWGNYKLVGYTPRHSARELAETARMFLKYGVRGIYRCGYGELWGLEGPGYYVFNRMLRDPEADVEATVEEFCTAAFGPAAQAMRRFYDAYDGRLDEIRPVAKASIDVSAGSGFMATFAKDANLAMLAKMWPKDLLREMDVRLRAAEATPGLSGRQTRRLKLVRLEYDYLVTLMDVVSRYGEFRSHASAATVLPLLDAVDRRTAFVERVIDPKTGFTRISDAWPELRLFGDASRELLMHNGRSAGRIEEPLDWKTADIRAAYDFSFWKKGLDGRTDIVRLVDWKLSEGHARATLEREEGGRRIHIVPAKETEDVRVHCNFKLEPRTKYRLSWLVKLQGVRPSQPGHEVYALVWFGSGEASRKRCPVPGMKLETTDWMRQTMDFETGDVVRNPEFAVRLRHSAGEAWIEDAVLEKVRVPLVHLQTEGQRAYFALDRQARETAFSNAAYRASMRKTGDRPNPVVLEWKGGKPPYAVEVTADGRTAWTFETSQGTAKVFNLEIGRTYGWTATDAAGVRVGEGAFRTSDEAPRIMNVLGVPNMRDLGGRTGLGGRRVRQGLVYRSAGWNNNAVRTICTNGTTVVTNWTDGASRITPATADYAKRVLGIRTDLDLRTDRECHGMKGSPLGAGVRWVHVSSGNYWDMTNAVYKAAFAADFRTFLDRKNYPIVFHCIAGADRTGSLACILNALLGIGEDDLAKDWEATAFATTTAKFRHDIRWNPLVRAFDGYPGASLNDRIEAYVKDCGFTDGDIRTFREIMLDGAAR